MIKRDQMAEIDPKEIIAYTKNRGEQEIIQYKSVRNIEQLPVDIHPLRLLASDVTSEKLVSIMKENDEALSIFSTEGGIFQVMSGLYSGKGQSSNIDVYLQAYSNDYVSIDRKNASSIVMYSPSLTILLYVQPQVIRKIMSNDEFKGRGLLARFCYVFPHSMIGERKYFTDHVDEYLRKQYQKCMYRLIDMNQSDRTLHVSIEADQILREYYEEIEQNLIDELKPIEAWAGKSFGQCARIAACLHAMKYLNECVNKDIETETILSAISIERYLTAHAVYAFSGMGTVRSKRERTAIYILEKIEKYISSNLNILKTLKSPETGFYEISKRDIDQQCRGRYDRTDKLTYGYGELICRNILRIRSEKTGGRDKELLILNPDYLKALGYNQIDE